MRLRSLFSNSMGILTSRIFGFVRDLLMASILGANIYSDMFFVAFKLPNLFRRIFAEGAFSQSFIPSFTASRHKSVFSTGVLLLFIFIVVSLSIIVNIFSTPVSSLIAPGFSLKEIEEVSKFVAIQFWYLPLIFIVSFFAALLQYREHFATTAFSTVLLNIAIITTLLLYRDASKLQLVEALSYAVVIGGVMQLLAHIIASKLIGVLKIVSIGIVSLKRYSYKAKEDYKRFFSNFLPAVWGNSTAQIMAFLDTWLASFLVSGSISYLYYANRVFQLPLALFAIALSIAIFPSISKMIKNRDEAKALNEMTKGFWILLFLLATASVVGIVFAKEIIWLLFERGSFTRSDTITTSYLLMIYLISLLPFGLSRLFSLWLYSNHRQKRAAKIATVSLIAYSITASLLFFPLQIYGLAIANSLSGFATLILLIQSFGFERFKAMLYPKRVLIFIGYILLITPILYWIHTLIWSYI